MEHNKIQEIINDDTLTYAQKESMLIKKGWEIREIYYLLVGSKNLPDYKLKQGVLEL